MVVTLMLSRGGQSRRVVGVEAKWVSGQPPGKLGQSSRMKGKIVIPAFAAVPADRKRMTGHPLWSRYPNSTANLVYLLCASGHSLM